MAILDIAGANCHRIAQILFDRLIGAIYLVAGREIQAFGNGFGIGGNIGLVRIDHIGHALELVFCSSTAGDRLGLPYGPDRIVEAGDVLPALGGIIAIGLGAHLDAAGSHGVKTRDVLGQLQRKGGAIGGDADVIALRQILGAAGNGEGIVQSHAARSRIASQLEAIAEGCYGMRRAVSIGITDAARALGTGKFRRCGIACGDCGGFVGTAAVGPYDLDGASLSAGSAVFRTGGDGVKRRILVQSDGKALIGRICQDFHILGGVFLVFLAAAALNLEGAALVQVDSGTRVIALEVHALACQGFQLGHVDRIGIRSTGGQVSNLASNLNPRRISTAYRNSTRGSYPSGSINIRICRRVSFIGNQVSLISFFPIGDGMSPQRYAAFFIGLGTGAKSGRFDSICPSRIAISSRTGFRRFCTITHGHSGSMVGGLCVIILGAGLRPKAHGNGEITAGVGTVAHSHRLGTSSLIAIADGQRIQA